MIRRGLVSISCFLGSGLSLATVACTTAAPASIPNTDRQNDEDKDSTPQKRTDQKNENNKKTEQPSSDKSLTIEVGSEVSVDPGATVTVNVALKRGADLKGSGTLTVTGLPRGVTANPVTVDENTSNVELVLVASKDAVSGRGSALLRAAVGSVEKTTTLNFVIGEGSSDSEDWCSMLSRCCDDMSSLVERFACIANVGVSEDDACKVHLLAYVAKGDCSMNTR
jgi:hypothetical protein